MSIITPIFAGAALFVGALEIVNRLSAADTRRRKKERTPDLPIPICIAAATIADDMLPVFTPNVHADDHITIVSSDAFYAGSRNGKKLINGINSWRDIGANVDYIVLAPDTHSDAFKELITLKLRDAPGKFRVCYVDINAASKEIRALVEKYNTMHPSLISGTNGRAMWIEGRHDRLSKFAYGVKFFSREAMVANTNNANELFDEYLADINTIRDDCACKID